MNINGINNLCVDSVAVRKRRYQQLSFILKISLEVYPDVKVRFITCAGCFFELFNRAIEVYVKRQS